MTVAAIYARYSSDSQRDESIEIQVGHCTALVEREGWTLLDTYADYALSGTTDARPEFQRMRSDMEAGKWDVLVIYKQDRLARNAALAQSFKKSLFALGKRLVSVRDGEVLDTPEGFLTSGMNDLIAEYYSRNLSVLIRDGVQKNAANCKANGQPVFGYSVNAEGRYEVDPDEAGVVRSIFREYVAGSTVADICRMLERQGERTRRGKAFSHQTVTKMLGNDRYIGVYRYAGNVQAGGMPAIVTEEEFEMAQNRLKGNPSRGNPGVYMLSGKLYCAECGALMTGTSGTSKSGARYDYYTCSGKCGRKAVRVERADDQAVGLIKKVLSDDSSVIHMSVALADYIGAQPDPLPALEKERATHKARLDKCVDAVADGADWHDFEERMNVERSAIDALDARIAEAEAQQRDMPTTEFVEEFVRKMVSVDTHKPKQSKMLLDAYALRAYLDAEGVMAVAWSLDGKEDWSEFDLAQLRSLMKARTPSDLGSSGVRAMSLWWRTVVSTRTPPCYFKGRLAVTVDNGNLPR